MQLAAIAHFGVNGVRQLQNLNTLLVLNHCAMKLNRYGMKTS